MKSHKKSVLFFKIGIKRLKKIDASKLHLVSQPDNITLCFSLCIKIKKPNRLVGLKNETRGKYTMDCVENQEKPLPILTSHGHDIPELNLPTEIVTFADSILEELGQSRESSIMAALCSLSNALADQIKIEVTPNWHERARFWVLLLASPGAAKSALYKQIMRFWDEKQQKLDKEADRAWARYVEELELAKKERGQTAPEPPPRTTCLLNNVTPEALEAVCADNPRGLFFPTQEVSLLLEQIQHSKSTFGSMLLELHDGGYRKSAVRLTTRRRSCENFSGGMLSFAQPELLAAATKLDLTSSGFIQRFVPIQIKQSKLIGAPKRVSRDAADALKRLTGAMYSMQTNEPVRMSTQARRMSDHFLDFKLMPYLKTKHFGHNFASHMQKYKGFFFRLMLTIHCARVASANISMQQDFSPDEIEINDSTVHQAAEIILRICIPNSEYFYVKTLKNQSEIAITESVREWLFARNYETEAAIYTSAREIRQGVRGFGTADDATRNDVINLLEYYNYITLEQEGRKTKIRINNCIPKMAEEMNLTKKKLINQQIIARACDRG